MLTVLSSFAQEESKNVSGSLKWRIKKKLEHGELIIASGKFIVLSFLLVYYKKFFDTFTELVSQSTLNKY